MPFPRSSLSSILVQPIPYREVDEVGTQTQSPIACEVIGVLADLSLFPTCR